MNLSKLRPGRKGVSTITAVFMLLLVFALMTMLLVAFFNYNISAKEQMDIEHERSQERIELTALEVNDQFRITSVLINNTGTIDVRIRALYQTVNGETSFLFDPSIYSDSQVRPTDSMVIYFPGDIPPIQFDPDAKIVASTERGTKTVDYVPLLTYGPIEPPSEYDPTKLYVGPLMLKFDDFAYHETDSKGNLLASDTWHPGWIVPKSPKYYAWKISIMNRDNRNITLNRFASFNLVPTESPSTTLSWYIEPTDLTTGKQLLIVNQTVNVMYIWNGPLSGAAQKLNLPETTCMVFLTFFGVFHEPDGTETPYAQTIPFEAAVTIT
jgi:hypothetical protein